MLSVSSSRSSSNVSLHLGQQRTSTPSQGSSRQEGIPEAFLLDPSPRQIPRLELVEPLPSTCTGTDGATGEKPIRDKAVASLARFLAGAKQVEGVEEVLEVGELNWDEETSVDARLAPGEMAKLWKGIFFCASSSSALPCPS